ncbi:hypothetical protein ZOSMA_208G00070 [Zostera marina]|uniref:Uncharacterized protein n=1 Tax=Zostera marina TaxID=29655 RepID=A0A0K9PL82_ZOSMR|nr:hypothetical protein ZOSMA_208G00070 [Zostera marina]
MILAHLALELELAGVLLMLVVREMVDFLLGDEELVVEEVVVWLEVVVGVRVLVLALPR